MTKEEKARKAEERAVLRQYLSEDDTPSLPGEMWERTKAVAKKTGKAVGEATEALAEEAAGWVDAGLTLIGVPVARPKPRRKRNPYI